ncbi:response regulator [Phenylobacterium sp.]|jgi:two-component system KDP operon response regulator KdpE|uniref:response regulator n=1 Tax=Phenylobacterium sp. TaxID=1871053 RepID=UPI002F428B28
MHKLRILVVDDEPQMHRFLGPALNAAGYEPIRADTGRQALAEIARRPPDAVVLDLGLPDIDGQEVLQKARAFFNGPIIILSARDREMEKIEALDGGADDYVEKPFRVGELLARLRVSMRRQAHQADAPPPVVHAGDLTIDIPRRLVTRAGEPVRLSPKEYELLVKLAEADGKVLTHKDLLVSLWGPAHAEDMQYLRVFIGQLRQKIEPDPSAPRLVLTQPGIGYRFMADDAARPGTG